MSGVGEEVKRLRQAKGWTQEQLAVYAGSSQPTVNLLEAGKRNPSAATLEKLARALGVEVVDLFPKAQSPLPDVEEKHPLATATEASRAWLRAHGALLLSLTEEGLSDQYTALYPDVKEKFANLINEEWQKVEMARDLAPDPNAQIVREAYIHATSRYLQARALAPISTSYDPDNPEKPEQVTIYFEKPKKEATQRRSEGGGTT
jgi:transcriptional regulator with XRE-family HTH domain